MGWLPRPRRQGRWSIVTVTLDRNVEQFIATPRQLFINGQWADAASGRTFETPNPATGETLARVAEGDAEDINRAVSAARQAFETGPWSRMTPSERGRIISRIGDLILERRDELAQLESLDNGKPFAVAQAADVPLAADLFHYTAGWATKIEAAAGGRGHRVPGEFPGAGPLPPGGAARPERRVEHQPGGKRGGAQLAGVRALQRLAALQAEGQAVLLLGVPVHPSGGR